KKRKKLKREEKDGTEEAQLPKEDNDDEEKRKKKSDDLWASFLSDVGSRPKEPAPDCRAETTKETEPSVLKGTSLSTKTKAPGPAKVTITKVFDFAGEEVRSVPESFWCGLIASISFMTVDFSSPHVYE
ncbi:hypothetical protein ATANTOWER_013149, partial [Ataeniobius toweri]|nr:hypothetical protein [Ataeniobius toweri]